ncbi:hypothetical protein [Streptomyces sp. NBC_01235]|uniref:hypothetical protein n=1 Tax=Streptomyces sp. NBC_01235 TaxID=2903788 RepID=UPI002E1135CD|nr:hypothetical protein OG289_38000 [Streptomyces sp. NBC_01235]
MRALRRAVLLCVPALCTLVSCGIPATGVVEAGGPAHGIVPTVRVYLVDGDALVAVPRRIAGQVGVESAVKALLLGPTEAERAKRLTTLLPQVPTPTSFLGAAPATNPSGVPTIEPSGAAAADPSGAATADPSGAATADPSGVPTIDPSGVPTIEPSGAAAEGPEPAAVRVATRGDEVSIQLLSVTAELTQLAAAQLICTAVDARHTDGPEIETVTVTVTNAVGRSVEGSDERCPDL